jgi:hypothetical protein
MKAIRVWGLGAVCSSEAAIPCGLRRTLRNQAEFGARYRDQDRSEQLLSAHEAEGSFVSLRRVNADLVEKQASLSYENMSPALSDKNASKEGNETRSYTLASSLCTLLEMVTPSSHQVSILHANNLCCYMCVRVSGYLMLLHGCRDPKPPSTSGLGRF